MYCLVGLVSEPPCKNAERMAGVLLETTLEQVSSPLWTVHGPLRSWSDAGWGGWSPRDMPTRRPAHFTYRGSGSEHGMLASVVDPLGNTTTFDYDAVGRRTSMVDPNGNASGATPSQHTWEYVYDNESRLRYAKAPAPSVSGSQLVTESQYDGVGNLLVLIDANGQVTRYLYDDRDSLSEVWESPSAWTNLASTPSPKYVTAYTYDLNGNLTRVTRASGDSTYEQATGYVYDGLNRVPTETQCPSWPSTSATSLKPRYRSPTVAQGLAAASSTA
jgi:YD repeat-containing protein